MLLRRHLQQFTFTRRHSHRHTICALASGAGRCGVSVIRVSGRDCSAALLKMTGLAKLPEARKALYRTIVEPTSGAPIDTGLVLWFPGPRSFTGEDVCEFQVHGSPAVIDSILRSLTGLSNVRLAHPGEFTKRAFYNNKMDLTEVENLADLLHAETEQQRKQAIANSGGKLRQVFQDWREALLRSLAAVEADIDFAETEDLSVDRSLLIADMSKARNQMNSYIRDCKKNVSLKSGIQAVIYGAPNVGKSSFFNAIVQSNKAIVSEIAGTTRDVLQAAYDIKGYPILFTDTAGIHEGSDDDVEKAGITKAIETLHHPETYVHILVFSAVDLKDYLSLNPGHTYPDFLKQYVSSMGLSSLLRPNSTTMEDLFYSRTIIVMNKVDLIGNANLQQLSGITCRTCHTSCTKQQGITAFLDELEKHLDVIFAKGIGETPRLTNLRQKAHLEECVRHIDGFLAKIENKNVDMCIVAEDLKMAARNLGHITGRFATDDVLDVIFSSFCIGK